MFNVFTKSAERAPCSIAGRGSAPSVRADNGERPMRTRARTTNTRAPNEPKTVPQTVRLGAASSWTALTSLRGISPPIRRDRPTRNMRAPNEANLKHHLRRALSDPRRQTNPSSSSVVGAQLSIVRKRAYRCHQPGAPAPNEPKPAERNRDRINGCDSSRVVPCHVRAADYGGLRSIVCEGRASGVQLKENARTCPHWLVARQRNGVRRFGMKGRKQT